MPNHCYQQVSLRGPCHLIHHLHLALSKSEPEFCNTIAPMPFELWAKETQPDQVMPDWYSGVLRTGGRSGMSARLRSTKMVLSIRMTRRLRGSRSVVGLLGLLLFLCGIVFMRWALRLRLSIRTRA